MNKIAVSGIIILVIVGVIVAYAMSSNSIENTEPIPSDNPASEPNENTEKQGQNLSVELSESIGFKSP